MTALPWPGTAASGASATCLYMQVMPGLKSSSAPPISSTSNTNKRKRRPAGTPGNNDPDAEVVALSPKTLMESDRYVCEICNQGFQRDQNLQMHRRRHKVPWKLLKRPTPEVRKRVYVCPDPTCMHNNPCHALGDLVGIKKHFRRKHSVEKQWKCGKCSKEYAVQSDYKAHLKTCGTRGHSCDCGRVFSRVESFIEHQDDCNPVKERTRFGYNDPSPSQPSTVLKTRSSNETMNAFAVLQMHSSPTKSFSYGEFQQQYCLNMVQAQRELQFIYGKDQSNASETTVEETHNNGGTSVTIKDYIRHPTTNPAAASERYEKNSGYSTAEQEDMSESGTWLQLSIGPCTHPENKPHLKTGRSRQTGPNLLSLQNISVHSIQ